jgi:hypothetical protein
MFCFSPDDAIRRDYAPDAALDRYDARDIDDEEEGGMSAEQRRAAERDMALRDRREARRGQGGRAARRTNAPDFLREEDEMDDEDTLDGGLLSDLTKRRTRRQYDERQNVDDAAGAEGVSGQSAIRNKSNKVTRTKLYLCKNCPKSRRARSLNGSLQTLLEDLFRNSSNCFC